MTRAIDTMHLGLDRVIAVWEREGVIVDPGPASTIETILASLDREPEAVLLTHIHLDHAGATGTLTERFPGIRVYVHEAGAPHLIDPSKLLRSAARLYGDEMDRLWGDTRPVPEANVTALAGGERVEGLDVIYAPGHASHHVVYVDPDGGEAFCGDVAGVLIPPGTEVFAPTPPPDIDVELWEASIDALEQRSPDRLLLTHFGAVEDPPEHLDAMRRELGRSAEAARAGERTGFLADLDERIDRASLEVAKRIRSAAPPEQLWLGLERYWSKRNP